MSGRKWTGEEYRELVAGLKGAYAQHKTWRHRRGGQGQDVAQLARQHGLVEQQDKGGIVFATPSIYWAWSVYEGNGQALLHYRDGGMGWDEMTLLATDKAALAGMRKTGQALGLVRAR